MAYLAPFLAFVLFVVAAFTFWFHYSVHNQIIQNIAQTAQTNTDIAAANLDHLISGMATQARMLGSVEELRPAPFIKDHYGAHDMLAKLYYKALGYDSIAFVYRDTDWVLTSSGTCLQDVYLDFPGREQLIDDLFSSREKRLINTKTYGASGNWSLLYALPLPIATYRPHYYLLFSFSPATIVNLLYLDEFYASDTTPIMAMYDADGQCIWNNCKNYSSFEASLTPHISEGTDASSLTLDGKQYLLTKASVQNGFLTLVSLAPMIGMYSDTLRTALVMMLACIGAIILFGSFTLYRCYVRCYKPVEQALSKYRVSLGPEDEKTEFEILSLFSSQNYNEYAARSGQLDISKAHLQSMFVLAAIKRQFPDEEELIRLQRNLDISFPHPYYFVCCFLFNAALSSSEQQQVISLLRSADPPCAIGYYSMMPDAQTLIGIINVPGAEKSAQQAYLDHVQALPPLAGATTIAIGNCYSSLISIGKSYLESCSAMDYRLINGRNSLLFYSELAENNPNLAEYPTQLMQMYPRILHTWDVEAIRAHLNKIQHYLSTHSISLQLVKCICYELLNGFLNEVRTLDASSPDGLNSIGDVFSIVEFDSIKELIEEIHVLTQRICEYMNRFQDDRIHLFQKQCMEYMQQNIGNSQFTLESLADQFGITPQTLRSRFKQVTGTTLIETMKKLRLQRACLLLETTELGISQIMAEVGYIDASSFSRTFKKETGLTPGEYRNRQLTRT